VAAGSKCACLSLAWFVESSAGFVTAKFLAAQGGGRREWLLEDCCTVVICHVIGEVPLAQQGYYVDNLGPVENAGFMRRWSAHVGGSAHVLARFDVLAWFRVSPLPGFLAHMDDFPALPRWAKSVASLRDFARTEIRMGTESG
jgi:hypothetical protein